MKLHWKLVLLPVLVLASSCDLINTSDNEQARGRGAEVFDPYESSASGALSLTLLYFNGCAILPSGDPVTKGTLDLPSYPDECQRLGDGAPLGPPQPPTAKFTVVSGKDYFVREITLMDALTNAHTDFNDRTAPSRWMRTESRFKSLDWTGMGLGKEDWRNQGGPTFQRESFFENAAWMLSNDDTFTLEVLDSAGVSRIEPVKYSRKDFLAENSTTGRTRASWTIYGLARPQFPNDPVLHPSPDFGQTIYLTAVKASFANSTNPFRSFRMPPITGEGYIRVKWSLMPDEPFVFPVTFVAEQEIPATCYKLDANGLATQERTPCGFGLKQTAHVNPPQNGKFFAPGETVDFQVAMQDGDGNGLHPRDELPSLSDTRQDQSNGIAYFNEWMISIYRDASSSESGFKIVGPLQDLAVVNGTYNLPYFAFPRTSEPKFYAEPGLARVIAGYVDSKQPTRYAVQLPPDAKKGTYALLLKGHRSFMGERLNRLEPLFFQVGQEEPTSYPGQVGNCQICHNGVNSLINLHHGLSVDHVEVCKTCHFEETVGHISDIVHKIHVRSRKYNQDKKDCGVCHLSRESALRPSLMACEGCHVSIHGSKYFDMEFTTMADQPNLYSNCAESCHVGTPPRAHLFPEQ